MAWWRRGRTSREPGAQTTPLMCYRIIRTLVQRSGRGLSRFFRSSFFVFCEVGKVNRGLRFHACEESVFVQRILSNLKWSRRYGKCGAPVGGITSPQPCHPKDSGLMAFPSRSKHPLLLGSCGFFVMCYSTERRRGACRFTIRSRRRRSKQSSPMKYFVCVLHCTELKTPNRFLFLLQLRDWSETNFYLPEAHWARLPLHIAMKFMEVGTAAGCVLGLPYALLRKRPVGATMGGLALCGGVLGLAASAGTSYYKFQQLDQAGIDDRSFRLAHNWNQTKWDHLAADSAVLGGLLLRAPFGGFLRGAAVGMAFGTAAFFVQSQFSSTEKPNFAKMKGV